MTAIAELQDRLRATGRTERAKAGVRADQQHEAPPDDGKARPHVSCNVAIARPWWRITWRGQSWAVLFSEPRVLDQVRAWAWHMAYDGAELEQLPAPPDGHGKAR